MSVVPGIPLLKPGDDLAAIIIASIEKAGLAPDDGDIVVVAQKVVSKAEGRYVDLTTVVPSSRAIELAAQVDKDPRLVEVILSESVRVVRQYPGVLIVEHRAGYVMANAGIDRSNVDSSQGEEPVLLLPHDSDAAAEDLRAQFASRLGKRLGVVINDFAVAYPLRFLARHELANDHIDGIPVSLVYCTLCRTGLLFDRRVEGQIIDFQTSGLLIDSNKIMIDNQTETLWHHLRGLGISGPLKGVELEPVLL